MVATLASQDPNLFDTSTSPEAVHAMNGRQPLKLNHYIQGDLSQTTAYWKAVM